jgi:nucleotide-binding universal stress UspA family protein
MSSSVVPEPPLTVWRADASQRDLVLCALADDGAAMDVIATGAHLAAAGRVDLVFVHVAEPADTLPIAQAALLGAVSAGDLGALRDEALHHGHELLHRLGLGGAHTEITVAALPDAALRAVAQRLGASMIVVGSGRSGYLRRATGNGVTQQLLRFAPCPVVVARCASMLDGADGPVVAALRGPGRAGRLSAQWGARLALLLDRPVVLARVGGPGRRHPEIDALSSAALHAEIESVVALRDATDLRAFADEVNAAAVAVPYAGPLGRLLGGGGLTHRVLAHTRAPVVVLTEAMVAPASSNGDAGTP